MQRASRLGFNGENDEQGTLKKPPSNLGHSSSCAPGFGCREMSMDWRETMQRMLVRMEEAGQWPAVCEEARAVLEAENEPSREPAAYLWGGCLWRTDEMERGRPGAAELYRAQTPMTDAEIAALLPTWQRGSWTLPDYGRWVARAVERAHGIKAKPNLCRLCGHEIYSHDRQYGCSEDGCDCETPNAE